MNFLLYFSSLRRRLLLLTILPVTIMIIVSMVSSYSLRVLTSELDDIRLNRVPLIETSLEMSNSISALFRISIQISQSDSDGLSYTEFVNAKKIYEDILKSRISYKKLSRSTKEILLSTPIDESWNSIDSIFTVVFSQVNKLDLKNKVETEKFLNRFRSVLSLLVSSFDQIGSSFKKLDKNRNKEMDALLRKNEAISKKVNNISISFSILGIIITIILGFLIGNKTKIAMSDISGELQEESSLLTVASGRVVNSSENLATIGSSLATSLEEITSQFQEILSMVNKNTDAVIESEKIASINKISSASGEIAVKQLVESIQDIKTNNNSFSNELVLIIQKINGMSQVINHIGAKSKIIDDIVFQTKLLSFNASVEASRAGDAGKGFSVVAGEIGSLASISGEAAKEISELLATSIKTINQIVYESQAIVENLFKTSQDKITRGSEIVDECKESFSNISNNITKLDSVISNIALSSREQAIGIKEVSIAVSNISQILNKNRELAVSSTEISEDLNLQAESLELIVEKLMILLNGKLNPQLLRG